MPEPEVIFISGGQRKIDLTKINMRSTKGSVYRLKMVNYPPNISKYSNYLVMFNQIVEFFAASCIDNGPEALLKVVPHKQFSFAKASRHVFGINAESVNPNLQETYFIHFKCTYTEMNTFAVWQECSPLKCKNS